MPRILLVRHGQSEWNAQGRWQGQADIDLSDLGRRQAHAAAANLGSFSVIASSTLSRAAETAFIISQHLGIGPIVPIPNLVERDAGEWSGLLRSDIEREWPGYLEENKRPPSYELDPELWERVKLGLDEVAAMLDGQDEALVVAHGGIVYMLEERIDQNRGRLPNLGAIWIDIDPNGELRIGERVELVDEAELSSSQASDVL